MEIYMPLESIVIDEEEFEEVLAEHIEDWREGLTDRLIRFFENITYESMEEALVMLETTDFDTVARHFHMGEGPDGTLQMGLNEEDEVLSMQIVDIISFLSPEDAEMLLALEPGETTGIMSAAGGWYILAYVETKSIPTDEELTESIRERFIEQQQFNQFFELLQEWVDAADYTVNRRALETA